MDIKIIKLPPERWEEYKNLRLEALKNEPTAFASSYEESSQYTPEGWQERLSDVLFAEVNGVLVGMMGIHKNKEIKRKHAVSIIGVYVKPEFRQRGIGKKLMAATLEEIKQDPSIVKVDLDVNTEQVEAQKLYEDFGFKRVRTWGRELKVNGKYYDLYEMEKFLDERL